MLSVRGLSKSFSQQLVLKNISFDIAPSKIAVLLGKSGVGKSTLLRCIAGLEIFDQGELLIDQQTIKNEQDFKALRGKIGFVFQNFNLFPHMTVLENITAAPIYNFNKPKEEAVKQALELLHLVELHDKANAYPYELSGGQQQRVAIARACALNPKVLCLDEPTSALDYETTQKIMSILNHLKAKGITLLIITHDLNFAKQVGDVFIELADQNVNILKDVNDPLKPN